MEKTEQELMAEAAAEAAAAVFADLETAEKLGELETKTEILENDKTWANEERQRQWIKMQELEIILTQQTEMLRGLTGMIAELQKPSYPPLIESEGAGGPEETQQAEAVEVEEVEKVEEMEPEPETEMLVLEEKVAKSRWI